MKKVDKLERNISIDRYRGLLVFSMIFFQLLEHFKSLGVFATISLHAPDSFLKTSEEISNGFKGIFILPNMTLADIIAPAFLFTISLTIVASYKRKCDKLGKKNATIAMIKRYLTFIGIGTMMQSINVILDGNLSDGYIDFIDLPVFVITISVILLGLIWFVLKNKNISKRIGKVISYIVLSLGIIGILISLINTILVVTGINENNFGYWLVLQHIGTAGIIATVVMALSKNNSTKYRLIVGSIILIIFTIFHETTLPTLSNYKYVLNNMNVIDNTADGGIIGGIAYSGLLLIFTAIADIYYKNKSNFRKITILLFIPAYITALHAAATFKAWDGSNNILTAGLSRCFSINKGSISPAYLVISLFISSLGFMIVDLFRNKKVKFDFLDIWGRNPIIMYILEFTLVGGIVAALGENLTELASLPIAIIEVITLTLTLTFIAYKLYKRGKTIKI